MKKASGWQPSGMKGAGWRQKQARYCDIRKRVLMDDYEVYVTAWTVDLDSFLGAGRQTNDKELFCRLYNILLSENENMKGVRSNYVNVAFSQMFEEDCERLNRIIFNFKELEGWVV